MNAKLNWKVICVLTAFLVVIAILSIKQDSQWIGFWGNVVGGIIGGFITLLALYVTINNEKERYRKSIWRYYSPIDEALESIRLTIVYAIKSLEMQTLSNEHLSTLIEIALKDFIKKVNDEDVVKILKSELPQMASIFSSTTEFVISNCQEAIVNLNKSAVPINFILRDLNVRLELITDVKDTNIKHFNKFI